MKVYVAIDEPYKKNCNQYISSLINGINCQFDDVEWGYGFDVFWTNSIFSYDIIHIHWPHLFYFYYKGENILEEIETRFIAIKDKGGRIVSTCHNFLPHYSHNRIQCDLYEVVYRNSDMLLHLGVYSYDLLTTRYPNVIHRLLYHHVYDKVFTTHSTKEESCRYLNLDPHKKYILCFGLFRDKEEREMIISLAREIKEQSVSILAPSFYMVIKRRNFFKYFFSFVRYWYLKKRYTNIIINKTIVDDNDVKYYYGASSISLIHRKKILNSGNVSLAFHMKKPVVGPNVGNIGPWLIETGNYVFDPNDFNSLLLSVRKVLEDKRTGDENYKYAKSQLSTNLISSQLYAYYKSFFR